MTAPGEAGQLLGRPASELDDAELEQQGTQAHATRNWVFLHGTAEQFARHTSRMIELEQEYLRRFPQRTWQSSGGAAPGHDEDHVVQQAVLKSIAVQLEAALAEPVATHPGPTGPQAADPVLGLLGAVAEAPEGRMHKLEVHQLARQWGVDRARLATLYTATEPLLATEKDFRVVTEAGRRRLATR